MLVLLKRASAVLSVILLIATACWLYLEQRWQRSVPASPEQAFQHGKIGLELMPLKYALVLDKVSGTSFRTGMAVLGALLGRMFLEREPL